MPWGSPGSAIETVWRAIHQHRIFARGEPVAIGMSLEFCKQLAVEMYIDPETVDQVAGTVFGIAMIEIPSLGLRGVRAVGPEVAMS